MCSRFSLFLGQCNVRSRFRLSLGQCTLSFKNQLIFGRCYVRSRFRLFLRQCTVSFKNQLILGQCNVRSRFRLLLGQCNVNSRFKFFGKVWHIELAGGKDALCPLRTRPKPYQSFFSFFLTVSVQLAMFT